jgi:hypothetical protein
MNSEKWINLLSTIHVVEQLRQGRAEGGGEEEEEKGESATLGGG